MSLFKVQLIHSMKIVSLKQRVYGFLIFMSNSSNVRNIIQSLVIVPSCNYNLDRLCLHLLLPGAIGTQRAPKNLRCPLNPGKGFSLLLLESTAKDGLRLEESTLRLALTSNLTESQHLAKVQQHNQQ